MILRERNNKTLHYEDSKGLARDGRREWANEKLSTGYPQWQKRHTSYPQLIHKVIHNENRSLPVWHLSHGN